MGRKRSTSIRTIEQQQEVEQQSAIPTLCQIIADFFRSLETVQTQIIPEYRPQQQGNLVENHYPFSYLEEIQPPETTIIDPIITITNCGWFTHYP